MTCPDCQQEMAKDVGGISGPSQAIQFNTHVCDCGGVHKAFMDDGRDLIAYWRDHPNTVPPNHKLVGPPTEDHKHSSRARQQERENAARIKVDTMAPAEDGRTSTGKKPDHPAEA